MNDYQRAFDHHLAFVYLIMAFSVIINLRKIFFGITMFGLIVWHMNFVAPYVNILNWLVPIAAALTVANEIAFVLYMRLFFERVQAVIITGEETQHNEVAVKNYELRFEFEGAGYSMPHQDSVFGRAIDTSAGSCQILVHRRPPRLAFVDTFSQRYMYLIIAVFLLCSVYSEFTNPL